MFQSYHLKLQLSLLPEKIRPNQQATRVQVVCLLVSFMWTRVEKQTQLDREHVAGSLKPLSRPFPLGTLLFAFTRQ